VRYAANTIEEMQKLLRGYRDNMRVEIEGGIVLTASTVADLRALPTWPNGLVLNIHVDLDPRRFIEDIGDCLVVKASDNRPLVFIYYGEDVARRSLSNLLTRGAARRIAAGIAKLPGLVQWPSKGRH
jgi:hypothetical protein